MHHAAMLLGNYNQPMGNLTTTFPSRINVFMIFVIYKYNFLWPEHWLIINCKRFGTARLFNVLKEVSSAHKAVYLFHQNYSKNSNIVIK